MDARLLMSKITIIFAFHDTVSDLNWFGVMTECQRGLLRLQADFLSKQKRITSCKKDS